MKIELTISELRELISIGMLPATIPVAISSAVTSSDSSVNADSRVRHLIIGGRFIDAVKLYRQIHDVGLKEAKDACDIIRKSIQEGQ